MHRAYASLFLLAIFTTPTAWAASIYKCKNTDGTLLYQEKPCTEEAKAVSSWSISAKAKSADNDTDTSSDPLVLGQSHNGHYFVNGAINDQFLNFLIDTGATSVAIPQALANTAGLRCLQKGFSNTANGVTPTCTTVIQKLTFGNFTLRNVDATISPNLDQPLLGMSVLKRFRIDQDNGQMRLSKNY
jgi:clan AA aspartic protease (TIGR02281 family)